MKNAPVSRSFVKKSPLFNLSEESRERMVKYSPGFAPCQSDWGDSKHVSRWGPAGAKHENHALSKPTPGSQLSLCAAELISCDKSWLQEATQEFTTFPGAEQIHSYLGIPVLHSETSTSLNWDNAWLTCWTSPLGLNSHNFLKGKKSKYNFNFSQCQSQVSCHTEIHRV